MEVGVKHTNELGGTLVIELLDGNVYEVSRYNSDFSVRADEGSEPPTSKQTKIMTSMYLMSSCSKR